MAAVLKIAMARKRHRGFESHALRSVECDVIPLSKGVARGITSHSTTVVATTVAWSGGHPCGGGTAEAALHGDLVRPGDEAALVGVSAATAVRELVGEGATDVGAEDRGEVGAGRLDDQQPRLPALLRDRDAVRSRRCPRRDRDRR